MDKSLYQAPICWRSLIRVLFHDNLKKDLGQCFLFNYSIVEQILSKIPLSNNILEIGPGSGILSYGILANLSAGSNFTLVEKDMRFIPHLENLLRAIAIEKQVDLQIICGDGLLYQPTAPIQLIANIPYNISSKLLYKMIKNNDIYYDFTLMLQREVAEKICKPFSNNAEYGALSAMAQCTGTLTTIMKLSPQSFTPSPSVYSQVIRYKSKALGKELTHSLVNILNQAFKNCGRKIINNFTDSYIKQRITQLGIENLRPSQVQLEIYLQLAKDYSSNTSKPGRLI